MQAIEATWDYSVEVSAKVDSSKITLSWPQDTSMTPNSYSVSRKSLDGTSWGQEVLLPGNTTTYTDFNVSPGTAYEYQIKKSTGSYTGYGYIYAGIQAPAIENRGKIILIVDNTYASQLASELTRLQADLTGDGWVVLRHDVGRNDSVVSVKNLIKADYNADPANVQAVFLFGHVPVPYSGNIVPDGHYPDHQGAWPADVYYGDIDGNWTDNSVNNTAASEARNRNVPGDGKFDQSDIPSTVELQVGRVDLANLPGKEYWNGPATFSSELDLLRNYLNKDHAFRTKQLTAPARAIVYDDFGIRGGEAFAASGYRNFSTFVGSDNIITLTNKGQWIPVLQANNYLWAYGCGAGSYTSIGGLGSTGQYNDGTTIELVRSDIKAVFTLVMGSWLGDWDSEDNIMRAILATKTEGLTSAWSGRPHWYCHPMGLGLNIGYCARLTQNNGKNGIYQTQANSAAGQIHVALMGDPTLRMHVVGPASSLQMNGTSLTWNPSSDNVQGYYVYRANSASGPFTRISSSVVNGTTYTDTTAGGGNYAYMVRAVKLENVPSGSYYNLSQGIQVGTGSGSDSGTVVQNPPPSDTTTNQPGNTTTNQPPVDAGSTTKVWVDDSLPSGAAGQGNGETWTWITSNPTPNTGSKAHQSPLRAGLHEHSFNWAYDTMTVNAGETLFTYVYLDPANLPSEIMVHWNAGGWDHRAYWGANKIGYGTDGTAGRRYMGPLPTAGQWVRLEVPAAKVAMEGQSAEGMAFSLYDGAATWDSAGKFSGTSSVQTNIVSIPATNTVPVSNTPPVVVVTNNPSTTNITQTDTNNTPAVTNANPALVSWVDDALPAGATGQANGDTWNWITSNPTPISGSKAHQSAARAGLHEHFFNWAWSTLPVSTGDTLFAYVYLDPANVPSEIMLHWNAGSWEHRAYWGANKISYGTDGTAGRRYMGPLPTAGQWVRLDVPAAKVGMEGQSASGMTFSLYDGQATWDNAGKFSGTMTNTLPDTNTPPVAVVTNNPSTTNITQTDTNTPATTNANTTAVAWVDDSLPAGASGQTNGDTWNWITSNPTPFSGSKAHQSALRAGLHEHSFNWAWDTMNVSTGDTLYAYIYINPASVPSEIMLHWNANGWEHRAYWGANKIGYGTDGTAGRRYMGAIPSAGQWVRLEVPASKVGMEGLSASGMAFSLHDGQATWDAAGKLIAGTAPQTNTPPVTVTNTPPPVVVTNNPSTTNDTQVVVSNTPPTTNITSTITNNPPAYTNITTVSNFSPVTVSVSDYVNLQMPKPGDHCLHILSPTMLELRLINRKDPDPAQVSSWNLVDSSFNFRAPGSQDLTVLVDGRTVSVQSMGFKRRPFYGPLVVRDLRLENGLFLQLSSPISEGQTVEVKNPTGTLWRSTDTYVAKAEALRFNPAIHVNQEGYVPAFPKKAMVGYYLGNLGEMSIDATAGFKLVDAASGNVVYQGNLKARPDVGFAYTPTPYQKVYEADFSSFTTPGEYRLSVPGMGASLPFLIHDGVAMDFARAYALGLYHQRCGTSNSMPYTRFTHDACHTAEAEVPVPESNFPFTWKTVANYAANYGANNAVKLTSDASSRMPFVNKGKVDVSGGHHDAGDYSKYTINSTRLIHYLMIGVDAFAGVADLDNLGLPESGDGISDIMQEAKWEADYVAKLQDADGGFYFLVYPRDREYESNVTPDAGDTQVVWPKTTSVTAASVAALAEIASSPRFKKQYPAEAALYMQKAQLGWKCLTNAIARYGKDGSYQAITHYGNEFNHDDELAWAACAMFVATGDPAYHNTLKSWFDPSDPNTVRWGWWRMAEVYGCAIRTYAFAARSGRLSASQLDPTYLAKCENQILLCAQEATDRSGKSSYGTSYPVEDKAYRSAGWYFSAERAFDITVGYQINQKPEWLEAILENINYEGGCNPANISYVTGLGWKRQREIVHQYAQNDRRVMPPTGIPLGNIQAGFSYTDTYKSELGAMCFPQDGVATAPYPYYDRWSDTFNVTTEFVNTDQARGLVCIAAVAALTPLKTQPWKPVAGQITCPGEGMINTPRTATIQVPGMSLDGARVVWEARDQEPAYGESYTFTPTNYGALWIEAEVQWPDGRRVFAVSDAFASNNLPTVSVAATVANASETGPVAGVWTFTRTGSTDAALTVNFQFSGTATKWSDYRRPEGDMPETVVIPAGSATATLKMVPVQDGSAEGTETATLTIKPDPAYNLNQSKTATINISD